MTLEELRTRVTGISYLTVTVSQLVAKGKVVKVGGYERHYVYGLPRHKTKPPATPAPIHVPAAPPIPAHSFGTTSDGALLYNGAPLLTRPAFAALRAYIFSRAERLAWEVK